MKKIHLSSKYYWLYSFVICSVCMYTMLSYSGVLSTGKYCILDGDSFEIYVPVIRNFCRNILNGDNIFYSWNNSLGMNTSLINSFYGAYNPFNILFLMFYKSDANIIVALIIILKTGLTGLCFQLFEKYVLKIYSPISLIFAVLYSMCSYQVSYSVINFIWMDALFVLPLSFMSIKYLKYKNNPIPLCLCYSYIFIVQFYMGYIVGIISFMFFLLYMFLDLKKTKLINYIAGYCFSVTSAALISSFSWMPAAYFLLNNRANDSTVFNGLNTTFFEVYNQLFFGNNNFSSFDVPNIYCGVLSLLCLPLFFLNKNISIKIKLLFGVMLLIVFLSFCISPLYIFWHAFDAPDGWNYRFAFCASFLVSSMCALTIDRIESINKMLMYISCIINILFYFIEMIILNLHYHEHNINTIYYLLINAFISVIWIALLLYFKSKGKNNIQIVLLFLLLTCFEVVGNGVCSFHKDNNSVPLYTENTFYSWNENQNQLMDFLSNDRSFYRVNYIGDLCTNSDTYSGYNGLSDFCTAENPDVRKILGCLGLATSPRVTRNFGINDVTKMLLGVKYDVFSIPASLAFSGDNTLDINENDYYLGLGYLVKEDILDFSFKEEKNIFDNTNQLISSMTGKEYEIYEKYSDNDIYILNDGIDLYKENDWLVFEDISSGDYSNIRFYINSDYSKDYMYFINDVSVKSDNSMLLEGGNENIAEFGGLLSWSYLKDFNYDNSLNGYNKSVIVYSDGTKKQSIRGFCASRINEDALLASYGDLSSNRMNIINFSNGKIEAIIEANEDKPILFTSIPYDENWEIIVNNVRKKPIPLLDNAFLGIELDEIGTCNLKIIYHVGWLREGILASCVGFSLLIIYFIMRTIMFKMEKNGINNITCI